MKKLIYVTGFLGGQESKNYRPISEALGFKLGYTYFVRPGADWDPEHIKKQIEAIACDGDDVTIIGISLGARIASQFTGRLGFKTLGFCPCPSYYYWAKRSKLTDLFRPIARAIIGIALVIALPFKWHRWWPLFGGTKPDGWFLSVYAILEQLWYYLDSTKEYKLDGAVLSKFDKTVNYDLAKQLAEEVVTAEPVLTPEGCLDLPHADCRPDGKAFGNKTVPGGDMARSAKAESYARAFKQFA